ncbi:MAG: hypothetical protein V1806_02410 [Pseudomonadota bacterium]
MPRPRHLWPRSLAVAAGWIAALSMAWLSALAWPAPAAAAESQTPPGTVVVLEQAQLSDQAGADLGQARPGQALELLGQEAQRVWVRLEQGQPAWLPAWAAAVLPGPPDRQAPRLARLAGAPLGPSLRRRLLAGCIEIGDSPWLVELAWGRPWRSYMVNLFRDEEHLVYRDQAGRPVLLRFKGGRLEPPPPRQACAVESYPSAR